MFRDDATSCNIIFHARDGSSERSYHSRNGRGVVRRHGTRRDGASGEFRIAPKNIVEILFMDNTDSARFRVLRNDEEQYSIWPSEKRNPLGWHDAGMEGSKEECLAHIAEVWNDITPRSLRRTRPFVGSQ